MSRQVLVTGGASFIGSHVVEKLLAQGDRIVVVDNLSSGHMRNLEDVRGDIDFRNLDLLDITQVKTAFNPPPQVVYHLAADHGGRGYVETHQVACANNFAIDANVLQTARVRGTERIVFASSGCVYPLQMQMDATELRYIREEDVGPPYYPDGLYGAAKLVAEQTLSRMWEEDGIQGVSCRFFTVYGPRAKENHAIMAMIARSFIGENPFEVWGDGTQIRNWTYVNDIATGMVASERLAKKSGYDVVNLGTEERISVLDAVTYICSLANYKPELRFLLDKPIGPLNRVAANDRMVAELELEPAPFTIGVRETQEWYFSTKNVDFVRQNLQRLLIERK